MKILVISDTHGRIDAAKKLIKDLNPDYTFHLGDMAEDCKNLEKLFPHKVIASVKGNNDFFDKTYPTERLAEISGKRFYMCHGHKYNVKSSLLPLEMRGRELGADIILFGHTHVPFLTEDGGVLMMNPGSNGCYGIIEINGSEVSANLGKYQ